MLLVEVRRKGLQGPCVPTLLAFDSINLGKRQLPKLGAQNVKRHHLQRKLLLGDPPFGSFRLFVGGSPLGSLVGGCHKMAQKDSGDVHFGIFRACSSERPRPKASGDPCDPPDNRWPKANPPPPPLPVARPAAETPMQLQRNSQVA